MTKRLLILNLPLMALALFTGSCATLPYEPYAREVKKRPQEGGIVAMHAEYLPEDRAFADTLMKRNCGSTTTLKILEEGEVAVGEKTDATSRKSRSYASKSVRYGAITFGSDPDETSTSETRQLKEWHLTYQCAAAKK